MSERNANFPVPDGSHHEDAPAQHEIDFMTSSSVAAADNMNTFKLAVKSIAKSHGLHATFMPKPKHGAGYQSSGKFLQASGARF